MKPVTLSLCAALVALAFVTVRGQDWPQWRGSNRDGVAAKSPALADSWPAAGPKLLWASQDQIITQQLNGGFGSVSIVGGRAYLYQYLRSPVIFTTRTLKADALQRLAKAKDAPPKDALDKIKTIKDKEFPSADALEKWFADNAIDPNTAARVRKEIPAKGEQAADVFYCLDANTGQTLWKQEFAGQKIHGNGCSSTVCVVADRLYATGGNTTMYCLRAKDGNLVWKSAVPREAPAWAGSSSPLVTQGLVILVAGQLTAFRDADGSVAWTQAKVKGIAPSPVLWSADGKEYLLCNSDAGLSCADVATGEVLWTVPGGGNSTVAVADDIAVIVTDKKDQGILAYKISPAKAEKIWSIAPFADRGTSVVIYAGHVYAVGGASPGMTNWRALCANLADGKTCWEEKSDDFKKPEVNTPIIADGKMFFYAGGEAFNLLMFRAAPDKYELLGKFKPETSKTPSYSCANPSIADGRLFLRLNDRVACYDLRK